MTSEEGQRGTTLIECLVATAIVVVLAGGFCHALVTYQAGYRAHASRVALHQQSQFALDLLVEEMSLAVWTSQGAGCPEPGVQSVGPRLSFVANLYDRTTELRDPAGSGQTELIVARTVFESNDLVRIVSVGDPADPSDDREECVRLTEVAGSRLTTARPLTGSYHIGSQMSAINLVSYNFDGRRGRLMRSQDGGSQRVAGDVSEFVAEWTDRELLLAMGMRSASSEHSVRWERRIAFRDRP
jgi:prepilin-type N-terminal cleavage/methylation domain-containing protein